MLLSQLSCWDTFRSQFPFTVTYRLGKQNDRADTLSCQEASAGDAEADLLTLHFSLCKIFSQLCQLVP